MKNIWICFLGIILIVSCNDPYKNSTFQVYDVNPISKYLDSRPETFSEWVAILHRADLYNALNQAEETFTAFVPNNEAVRKFLENRGILSVADMDVTFARDLVFYHIINDGIPTNELIEGGKLSKPTVSEDYLTVDFGLEGGMGSIYINNEARILEFAEDSVVSNGYVYVLETTLTPLLESLYERLGEYERFSIFKEAVEITGWQNRLNTVYDTTVNLDGSRDIFKRNFTLLGVTDDVYAESSIYSLDDLKNTLNASSDYTSQDNALYKYIGYHLIQQTYYPEDLFQFGGDDSVRIWSTQATGHVLSTNKVNEISYINYNYTNETGIQLVTDNLNELVIARNGVILEVDNYMPVFEPNPVTVMWDLTDYEEVKTVVNRWAEENGHSNIYQQFHPSTEQRIPFESYKSALSCYNWNVTTTVNTGWPTLGYLVTRANSTATDDTYGAYKHDFLLVNLGYLGNVTMESPTLLKGKYKVELFYGYGTSLSSYRSGGSATQVTFDNSVTVADIYKGITNSVGVYPVTLWDEIELEETTTHTLKITLLDSRASTDSNYRLQLDYVKFTPLNN